MEGMLELAASALRLGVPVAICALGALWSERSGVINIGLEGMMMIGAFWGAAGAYWYGPQPDDFAWTYLDPALYQPVA